MSQEKYISIPELAKMLGVSRIAVYKQVKKGKIKAIRIGKNYAIHEKYIDEILGTKLTEKQKEEIKAAVKKTVADYGNVLRRLGKG